MNILICIVGKQARNHKKIVEVHIHNSLIFPNPRARRGNIDRIFATLKIIKISLNSLKTLGHLHIIRED